MALTNWLTALKAYYRFTAAHPMSGRATLVYGFMLNTFNDAFWPEWAELSTNFLAGGTNLSRRSVERGRAELTEAGIIDYVPQSGNKHPKYRLRIPRFWFHDDIKTAEDYDAALLALPSRAEPYYTDKSDSSPMNSKRDCYTTPERADELKKESDFAKKLREIHKSGAG